MKTLLLITITLLSFRLTAQTFRIVDAGGSGNYTTIQAAVDAANEMDVIEINSGVYPDDVDAGNKKLFYRSKDDIATVLITAAHFKVATGSVVKGLNFQGNFIVNSPEGATYRSSDITLLDGNIFSSVTGYNYANIRFINNSTISATFTEESVREVYNNKITNQLQVRNIARTESENATNVIIYNNDIRVVSLIEGSSINSYRLFFFNNKVEGNVSVYGGDNLRGISVVANKFTNIRLYNFNGLYDVEILGNEIGYKSASSLGYGIQISIRSSTPVADIYNLKINNNLIDSCLVALSMVRGSTSGNVNSGRQEIEFRNNVINNSDQLFSTESGVTSPVVYAQNNIITNCNDPLGSYAAKSYFITNDFFNTGDYPADINSLNVDPLFLDPANGDFHLQSGSPCIDAGAGTAAIDLDLTPNDLGIYGGPYSMENYEGADPRVMMLNLDRTSIDPGEDITIKATGVSGE
ncbi:MAG: hypothetical protein RIC03_06150 [Cyclobacteriaceae bacterium]